MAANEEACWSEAGRAVAEAIRQYHARHHRRYPKGGLQAIAADLSAEARRVAAGTPALYPAAERLVRNEEWAKRTLKPSRGGARGRPGRGGV